MLEGLGLSGPGLEAGRDLLAGALVAIEECVTSVGGAPTQPTPSNPPPATTRPAQQPAVHYQNCDDARARGATPVYAGQPGYRAGLDSDDDGIGCEQDGPAVTPATAQSATTGPLAYTGVELEPLLLGGAILLSAGTLLQLAGRRRRA